MINETVFEFRGNDLGVVRQKCLSSIMMVISVKFKCGGKCSNLFGKVEETSLYISFMHSIL